MATSSSNYHPVVRDLLHLYDHVLLEHAAGCCGIDFDRDVLAASPTHDLVTREAIFECVEPDNITSDDFRNDNDNADHVSFTASASRRRQQHLAAVIALPAKIFGRVDRSVLARIAKYHPNKKKFIQQLRPSTAASANASDRRLCSQDAPAAISVEDLLNDTASTTAASTGVRGHSATTERGGAAGNIFDRPLTSDEVVELTLAIDRFNNAQRVKTQTLTHYRDVCNALHEQENLHSSSSRDAQLREHSAERQRLDDQKELDNLLLLERQAIAQKMALRDELDRQRRAADAERQEQLDIQRACLLQSECTRAQAREDAIQRQRLDEERRAKLERMRLQAETAERNFQEAQEAAEHRKFMLLHSREVALREKSETKRARQLLRCKMQKEAQERKAQELLHAENDRRVALSEALTKAKHSVERQSESSARRQSAYTRASEASKTFLRNAESKVINYAHRVQQMEEEQRRRQLQLQQEAEEAQQHRSHAAALARARAEARRQEAEELFILQEARRQETAQARELQRKLNDAEAKVKEDERRERIERTARAKEYRDAQFRRQLEEKESAHGESRALVIVAKAPNRPAASAGFIRRASASSSTEYSTLRRQLTEIKGKGATTDAASALDSFLQNIHKQMVELRQKKHQQEQQQ